MGKHRILITGKLHDIALEKLSVRTNVEVAYFPDCSREVLLQEVREAHVLISRSETTVDREVIDLAPNLMIIARAAVGIGNIDVYYATEKGLLVLHCPGKNTNAAAEHTMALLLAIARKLNQAVLSVKNGLWDRHRFTGFELRGRTIGLIGLGNVGHRVAKFAKGFDMKVLAYDPYISTDRFARFDVERCDSLLSLVSKVDIVSLHVPLTRETDEFMDEKVFSSMKKGAIFINAARGEVVKDSALLAALNSDQILWAGLDTFQNEPDILADLRSHPKVIATPHIGASTVEAQESIAESVTSQVLKALDGGVVDHPVNLPNVGVHQSTKIRSYGVLAEKLGRIVGQMIEFNPRKVEVSLRGDLSGEDSTLIRLSFMKGYGGFISDSFVSYVNVERVFEKLGIDLIETHDPDFDSYKSALKISVSGDESHQKLTIGGVVYDDSILKLTMINGYVFDVAPQGNFIVLENQDIPGVVGKIGKFLGDQKVNIDNFYLARNRPGGVALALIGIDGDCRKEVLDGLKGLDSIKSARSFNL